MSFRQGTLGDELNATQRKTFRSAEARARAGQSEESAERSRERTGPSTRFVFSLAGNNQSIQAQCWSWTTRYLFFVSLEQ